MIIVTSKPIITPDTLCRVYKSNAELRLNEFREIVETSGHRLTGRWDPERDCPEIVKASDRDRTKENPCQA
jgi:hypothetical protein